MRSLQILLIIGLMICLSHAVSFNGLSNITIKGNEDPGACNLTLSMSLEANQVVFTETVDNPNSDCTYHNLQFAPVFRGDPIGGNITLTQVGSTNSYTGVLSLTDLNNVLGKYCGNLGDNGFGANFWACRLKYGSINLLVAIFVNKVSGQLETNWTDLLFPEYGANVNSANDVNFVTPNNSFPQLIARLPNAPLSWDNTITNLSQPIYVVGTEKLSNQVNLTAYFSDFFLVAVIVHKSDGSYVFYRSNQTFYPFTADKQGPNNSTNTGLTWDQPLDSLNDCVKGCNVTIGVQKGYQGYVLQTTGIVTKPATLLRA